MFNKALFVSLSFAAIAAFSQAKAATITDLGNFTGGANSNSASFGDSVSGTFDEEFKFTTTTTARIGVTITNVYESLPSYISNFTISLYSGPNFDPAELIATATDLNPASPSGQGFQFAGVHGTEIGGTYYFSVSGTTADTPSFGGSLNIAISTVPLPASLPMFGGALLALAGFGYGIKRKASAEA